MTEESIFSGALGRSDPADRAAFLNGACGTDLALRERVEKLLRAHEAATGVLDRPVANQPPTAAHQPLAEVGARIGPYKLLQQIGEGGMGTVWMAEQAEPVRRTVALKIIKPGMDSAQVIARFEAERQALALMDHPNIAKVLDAGTTDTGRPFFVMELVKGIPITQYSDRERLSPRERLELLVPVCQAIQHAHQKGIIHRDIKPSNVLVASYDGRPVPKVIDFGVAKATGQKLTERTLFTGFGGIVGTLEYMSPEQAEFNALDVDTRSDIYSLGVLLYELLTGTTPLTKVQLKEAAITELLRLIREEEPPRPSTRLSGSKDSLASISAQRRTEPGRLPKLVRGELDWIVMKSLEKDRSRRYDTANAMARDISRYLADEPVEACPPTLGYRLRKFTRKHKGPLLTAAAFVLLLVAGAAFSAWQAVRATQAQRLARKNERRASFERDAKEIARREAVANAKRADKKAAEAKASAKRARDEKLLSDHRLYTAHMNLAQRNWEDGHIGRLLELLDGQRPEHMGGIDLRGFEWNYWQRACHGELMTIPADAEVFCVAFSPDGKWLASGGPGNSVTLWEVRTGKRDRVMEAHSGAVRSVAFSPDGKWLASAGNDQLVKVWNAADGALTRSLLGPHANFNMVWIAFSEDGETLIAESPLGTAAWAVASGEPTTVPQSPAPQVNASLHGDALSPDGQWRAVRQNDGTGTVQVQNVLTGHAQNLKGHTLPATCLAFSPDGRRLASASFDGTIKVWDAANGTAPIAISASSDRVLAVAFSLDGRKLAVGDRDGAVTVCDTATGLVSLNLAGHRGQGGVDGLAFSPNGTQLATASWDGTAKVWDAATGDERTTFQGHKGWVSSVSFNSDGTRLATASWDGTAKIWEAATGRLILNLEGHQREVFNVAFSPDGKRLASGGADGTVRLWNATSGESMHTFPGNHLWVRSVAFSPDGKRLAAGLGVSVITAGPGEIRVWDLASKQQPLSLKGHYGAVTSVSFSSDGKRLASGTESLWDSLQSGELKVWDLTTGQESLTLREHTGAVSCVAFSHDGRWLASGSHDGTVKVYDARPWTPELRAESEALGLVRFLFARPLAKADMLATIHRDETINDEVRKKALELAERFREETDAAKYHAASWNVLHHRFANRFFKQYARMQAATACRLQPDNGLYRMALGVAQYRLGEYEAALVTLARAAEINAKESGGPRPAEIAFQAMAHQRLGRTNEAVTLLEQLRELLAQVRWKDDAEAHSYFHEAAALIKSDPQP